LYQSLLEQNGLLYAQSSSLPSLPPTWCWLCFSIRVALLAAAATFYLSFAFLVFYG
jgi:hypothetical protein